jgi:pimeloyl-ACP methyl ester carboxylesterase
MASGLTGETRFVTVGQHRIEVTVFGSGEPTVVFESGFGGRAAYWQPIAEALAAEVTVVTYDRCPYGASSAATDGRTPREIASDLYGVLDSLGIASKLVLVGHSSGGRCIREFAAAHLDRVAGMVFVDSSVEGQQQEVIRLMPWKLRLRERFSVPLLYLNRDPEVTRAARRSMARELRALNRQTRADLPLKPGGLGDRPLIVLTRPADDMMPQEGGWDVWRSLHQELAELSHNHRHAVTSKPGHYIHFEDPDLVTQSIRDVIVSARTNSALKAAAVLGPGPC